MKKFLKFLPVWAMALAVGFAGCKDDDNKGNLDDVIEDGYYVVGEASALTAVDLKGKLLSATNEATTPQTPNFPELYEKYIALEAGKEFTLVQVKGTEQVKLGADVTIDSVKGAEDQIGSDIPVAVQKGALTATGKALTVPESGLYQVVVYKTEVFIIPVRWDIYGNSGDKVMTQGTFGKESMTFTATDYNLKMGKFKLRSHNGWKYIVSVEPSVKINCNLGGKVDALAPGGADMVVPIQYVGTSTLTLTWSLDKTLGYALAINKTAEPTEPIDLTSPPVELIGAAVGTWDVGTTLAFNSAASTVNTDKSGIYVFEATNVLVKADQFKVRTAGTWGGLFNEGWNGGTWIKGDVANFEEGFDKDANTGEIKLNGNIKCKAETTYSKVSFKYDVDKDTRELTFTK